MYLVHVQCNDCVKDVFECENCGSVYTPYNMKSDKLYERFSTIAIVVLSRHKTETSVILILCLNK